jgi:hypothetical protein
MKTFQREFKDELKIVHLVKGPAIIAKVSTNMGNLEDDYYVLEDPFNIMYVPPKEPEDNPTFKVFDMMVLSSESEIEVATKHVMYFNIPSSEIADQYNSMLMNNLNPISDND